MMPRRSILQLCILLTTLCLVAGSSVAGEVSAGSAFTYQGRLAQSGAPVDGAADLQFGLFDGPDVKATQIGTTIAIEGVMVSDGLVSVELDFGASAFMSGARWLEIAVRSPAGSGDFTTLAPRQRMTVAPQALWSLGPWQLNGADLFFANGDVGVGTANPLGNFHVSGGPASVSVRFEADTDNSGESDQPSIIMTQDGGGVFSELGFFNASNDFTIRTSNSGGTSHILLNPDGNIGIATSAPQAMLHVATGTDATGASGGFIICGSLGAANLAIDDNEIVARTNGVPSPLFINSEGGDVAFIPTGPGAVGIGTGTPAFLLHVDGSAGKPGGGAWSLASDVRLKTNVQQLDGALESLMALRGVTFNYIDPESIHELPGTQIGMIAQEVEQVFPQWIDEGPNGYKRLTYRGFEALTVESLRELRAEKDAQIESLRAENQQLHIRLAALEKAVSQLAYERGPADAAR